MSISIFNKNQSLLTLVYLLFYPFVFYLIPDFEATKIEFYFKELSVANWLLKLVCVILLALSAYFLNNFVNNSSWLKDGFSHLPGLIFTILLMVSAKWINLNLSILLFCLVYTLHIFEQTLKKPKVLTNAFHLGILLGIGFIAFWQFIIVFLVILFAWNYLRPFVWRENVWLLIGFILPIYIVFSVVFLMAEPSYFTLLFALNMPDSLSDSAKVSLIFSLVLGVFASIKFIKNTSQNTLKSRQVASSFYGVYIGVLLFMMPVYFFQENPSILLLLVIPASILITTLFFNPNKKLATNLVFYLWGLIALLAIFDVY